MSGHPGFNPPFEEAESVQKARALARRLGSSDLPILVLGEVGTGRRTLATALADIRSKGLVVTFNGFDGVPDELRAAEAANNEPPVAAVHHLAMLAQRGQVEIATYLNSRSILLVAIEQAGRLQDVAPELRAALDATTITLPPLQERGSDALGWAKYMIARAAAEIDRPTPIIGPDAEAAILSHTWPGNLTELEAAVRKAVLLGEGDSLAASDLGFGEKLVVQPLKDAIEQYKMEYVAKVLDHFEGNRTQAAKALGIDPRTMFRYLEKARGDK